MWLPKSDDEAKVAASNPGNGVMGFLRRHRAAVVVLVVILGIVFLIVRQHERAPSSATQGQFRGGRAGGRSGGPNGPVAVAVATAVQSDIQVRIPALGTVIPLATVTVKTQISGLLQKIAFEEGQLVRQGDFLAQIDPRPYQAALDQAEGNLRRDEALLADARLDLKRYEQLITEDSIAQQQLDTQRALVDQDIGVVGSDKAAVEAAKVNLVYTHIVSPVTGRVGLRQVDQGNYVTPGDANGIVIVTQLQPISAIFAVPEDYATPLMQHLHAGQSLVVEAYDRANSTKLAEGKLETLDNEIDATTGTIKMRALFDNKDGLLFANQFVNIQLVEEVLRDQTTIPNAAVRRGAPDGVISTFVYVVKPDSTVSVRPVTLGVVDGERVSVTKGLSPGDVVVTEGADRLRDGAPVQLPQNSAATPHQPGAHARNGQNGQHRNRAKPPASQ